MRIFNLFSILKIIGAEISSFWYSTFDDQNGNPVYSCDNDLIDLSSIESDPECDCQTFKTHFKNATYLARNVTIICQWHCATKLQQLDAKCFDESNGQVLTGGKEKNSKKFCSFQIQIPKSKIENFFQFPEKVDRN
jgi:hypothetical protein